MNAGFYISYCLLAVQVSIGQNNDSVKVLDKFYCKPKIDCENEKGYKLLSIDSIIYCRNAKTYFTTKKTLIT